MSAVVRVSKTLPKGWSLLSRRYFHAEKQALLQHCGSIVRSGQFAPYDLMIIRGKGHWHIARRGGGDAPKFERPAKPTLISMIKASGLAEEFRAIAHAQASEVEIKQWLRSRPELAEATIPACLRYTRTQLGCPQRHGGPRGSGKPFMRVLNNGRVLQ